MEVESFDPNARAIQGVECCGVSSVSGAIGALTIVQAAERPLDAFVWILNESCRSSSRDSVGELHVSPALRHVHIDGALRTPDPVIFGQRICAARLRSLYVAAFAYVGLPLDAREIESPAVAGSGSPLCGRGFFQHGPWKRELDRPAAVAVARLIHRAFDVHACLQAIDVPAVDGRAA